MTSPLQRQCLCGVALLGAVGAASGCVGIGFGGYGFSGAVGLP